MLNLFALGCDLMNYWVSSIEWNLIKVSNSVLILSCSSVAVSSFESDVLSCDTEGGLVNLVADISESKVKKTTSGYVTSLWYRRSAQWTEQACLLASIL